MSHREELTEEDYMYTCRGCQWFSNPGSLVGKCRLSPPNPDKEDYGWPTMEASEGCGSWRMRWAGVPND